MIDVTLDAVLRSKLPDLSKPVNLRDETGRLVAQIIPALNQSKYEPSEPPFTEEELRRSELSTKWHSTAEVLAHLKSL